MNRVSRFKKGDKAVELFNGKSIIYLIMKSSDGWCTGVVLQTYGGVGAGMPEVGDMEEIDESQLIALNETVYV